MTLRKLKTELTGIGGGDHSHPFEVTSPLRLAFFLVIAIKRIRSMVLHIIRLVATLPRLNLRTIGPSWSTSPIQRSLQRLRIKPIHGNAVCLIGSIVRHKGPNSRNMKQIRRRRVPVKQTPIGLRHRWSPQVFIKEFVDKHT